MDKKELERRLEAAEKQNLGLLDEIQNLKAQLAEMQDEPEIPDFPVFNSMDVTYSLDSCLDVLQEEHGGGTGDGDYTGDDASFYNNFHSADYADEFRRKCLLIAMMLHCKWYLCYNHHPDFNGDIQKWTVVFDYKKRKFAVEFSRTREWSTVYFDTEENAKKCAEWLNRHLKEVTE